MDNSNNVRFGSYTLYNGVTTSLTDNTAAPTTVLTLSRPSFTVEYRIARGTAFQRGTITVDFNPAGSNLTYTQDYTENASTGVTLSVIQSGTNALIKYTTTSTGQAATFNYSINLFS